MLLIQSHCGVCDSCRTLQQQIQRNKKAGLVKKERGRQTAQTNKNRYVTNRAYNETERQDRRNTAAVKTTVNRNVHRLPRNVKMIDNDVLGMRRPRTNHDLHLISTTFIYFDAGRLMTIECLNCDVTIHFKIPRYHFIHFLNHHKRIFCNYFQAADLNRKIFHPSYCRH